MAKGQQTAPTQTSTYQLAPEQREILNLAMPGLRSFAATVPQRYPGTRISPFDPSQVAGQEMALAASPIQAGLAGNAADASNFYLSGDIWNPASNPALQGAVDAAVRPITENLTERQLPAIRGEAITTGNFGSSRQGIAEGIANREASRAIGDTASKLVQGQYDTNVGAQLKAMGLLPTVQGAQVQPAITTSGVGDVRQNLAQSQLGEQVAGFNYDQLAPFLQSRELISLLTGIPGGTNVTTGSVPTANPWTAALGGAASGAALGSAIMPGVGTGIGAAGGALLPFLFA